MSDNIPYSEAGEYMNFMLLVVFKQIHFHRKVKRYPT